MKRFFLTSVLVTLLITSVWGKSPIFSATETKECNQWVDSVFNTLTFEQRIAQLFIPIIDPKGNAATESVVKSFMGKYGMGGFIYSKGSLKDCVDLVNLSRKYSKVAPLVTIDGEWGLSMRISDTPRFPHNMGLGAISNTNLLYDYGYEIAREMKLAGINVNFAPVLDVNVNPANPVIGYRSFGENPLRVAAAATAYAKGLEAGGALSCGKHFPGHGDTSADSHKTLPTVEHSRTTLNEVDLLPFEKYFTEGSAIMTAHLNVPALDASGTPASLSKKITTDLLRNELGFKGLIFTDGLGMKGARIATGNNCVEALLAGADMLVAPLSPINDLKAVETAVKSGKISKETIDNCCRRVLAFKYALGLNNPSEISVDGLMEQIDSPQAKAVNQALANASMTLVRDPKEIVPMKNLATNSIAVVNIGSTGKEFSSFCKKYGDVAIYNTTANLSAIKKHNTVIAAVYSDSEIARAELAKLKDCNNLVEVFFINPYKAAKFKSSMPESASILFAYDNTPQTQQAAAQAVFGGITIDGHLPVSLEGIAEADTGLVREKSRLGYTSPVAEGMNPNMMIAIDSLINSALDTKAIPGGQLIIARNGNIVVDKSFGKQSMNGVLPVTDHTLYDLASVSKATGTLPGVMKAYDLGMFNLKDLASKHIPGLRGTNKEDVTVEQLLYHESGIQPSLNMFTIMMDPATYTGDLITGRPTEKNSILIQRGAYGDKNAKIRRDITSPVKTERFPILAGKNVYVGKETYDTVMARIYNSPLRKNKNYAYSCLNFCLLMDLEQHLTGIGHDKWVHDSIYAPLGANLVGYRPTERFTLNDIASTEHDTYLRNQTICGYVHDELADFSAGVQGNAGLFSNAGDLAKLCQMWLNGGTYGDARVLSQETVDLFTKSKSPTCRRGLGFDKPDKENDDNSPTCSEATAATYGHLGFTGTVFWVDPDNQLIFIFLNNRVNPTRNNDAFAAMNLRPDLFREVYKSIQ